MSSRFPGAGDLYGLAGGGVTLPYLSSASKRPISELEQQQILLLRSVKPKTSHQQHYLHQSPISPFDLPTATLAFHKQQQQLLLQQRHAVATHLKSRLEELEKHLLLDDDPNLEPPPLSSEWSHTLLSATPSSPSPSSSASTSSSPSSSPPSKKILLDAASAIADGNNEAAIPMLSALHRTSGLPRPDPEQRLCGYLASALLSRINNNNNNNNQSSSLSSGEHLMGTQLLYEASPCFKLAFLAANLAIVDSTRSLPSLHVLDFDLGNGSQYVALLNTLSSSSISLKITAVSDPHNPYTTNTSATHVVKSTGDRLTELAKKAGVSFHFNSVTLLTSELTRQALGCDHDEPLAVNLAFLLHKVPDESVTPANPRDELLRRVKALNPNVVTVIEHEINGNTTPFLPRFSDAFAYYSALFDSLDATMGTSKDPSPAAAAARTRIEDCLGRKAANAVASEGPDRVERCEVFGKWRARMGMAGFRPRPLPSAAADALRSRLALGRVAFTVSEDNGGLNFGYSGRILTVTSAWH